MTDLRGTEGSTCASTRATDVLHTPGQVDERAFAIHGDWSDAARGHGRCSAWLTCPRRGDAFVREPDKALLHEGLAEVDVGLTDSLSGLKRTSTQEDREASKKLQADLAIVLIGCRADIHFGGVQLGCGAVARPTWRYHDRAAPSASAFLRPGTSHGRILTLESSAPTVVRTLAFLFTDVEGRTRLWERHPDAMRDSLAQHDRILTAAVAGSRGQVIRTTADGIMAVFETARDGVAACVLGLPLWPWDLGMKAWAG